MILSYMYPIRTGHQTAIAKQGAAKAAKHHHKRLKGARGQGGVQRGAACSRRLLQGVAAEKDRGGAAGARLKALGALRRGPGGACP